MNLLLSVIKFIQIAVYPKNLKVIGSLQADLTKEILDSMIDKMKEGKFDWDKAKENDGFIEIWEINGKRYLANGNHRYFAAEQAGVSIPKAQILIMNKEKTEAPTFLRENMNIVD